MSRRAGWNPWPLGLDRLLYGALEREAAWLGAGHDLPIGQSLILIGENGTLIPMFNIAPQLAATEAAWKANLARLFERMHFISGEQLQAFEQEFAGCHGSEGSSRWGVGTGTAAIEICLRAAGLGGSGREVIVPTLTSLFTAQAILAAGCVPRFADIDPETLLLDVAEVERLLGKKTGAILPVHLYGHLCALTAPREACPAGACGFGAGCVPGAWGAIRGSCFDGLLAVRRVQLLSDEELWADWGWRGDRKQRGHGLWIRCDCCAMAAGATTR